MTELKIYRGLPASGKTTLAKAWVAEDPASRARVNRDDLRRMLHDGVYLGHETEGKVVQAEDALIRSLLEAGASVACDDTNLSQKRARGLAALGLAADATVRVSDLTDVPLELCLERDWARIREGRPGVGDEVIQRMYERYGLSKAPYPLPFPYPEAVATVEPYVPDESLPPAWLVDVDGTLALMDGRGPFEWHRVGEDAVNLPVRELVGALAHPVARFIVLLSGRDEVCRPETEAWLRRHDIPYDFLFMRPAGDTRKDAVVKLEIFREQIAPRFAVRGVIDDRDQVVEMWRSLGLTCAQVAPGAF